MHSTQNLLPIPSFIENIFSKSSLEFIYRSNDNGSWNKILHNAEYVPFAYMQISMEFQSELQTGNDIPVSDISVILLNDNKPCAVWPVLYKIHNNQAVISSFGAMLLPPLFSADTASVTRKKIIRECLIIIIEICREAGISTLQSEEVFLNRMEISDWHYELIRMGAVAKLKYDLYIDLRLDLELIKRSFRKSYKSLISLGFKTWEVSVMQPGDLDTWQEFKKLHYKVSGRITRSDRSWDIHYDAIQKGNAFLIWLKDQNQEMVGAGFFLISPQEAYYGIGVYDRTLFDKPLGHVVQFAAIEHMKKTQLSWYKVGTRVFPTDTPAPTEKEVSVTIFKEGFATNIFPKYILELPVNTKQQPASSL